MSKKKNENEEAQAEATTPKPAATPRRNKAEEAKAERYRNAYAEVLKFWRKLQTRLARYESVMVGTETTAAEWKEAQAGKREILALSEVIEDGIAGLNDFGKSEPLARDLILPMVWYTAEFNRETGIVSMSLLHTQPAKASEPDTETEDEQAA